MARCVFKLNLHTTGLKRLHKDQKRHQRLATSSRRGDRLRGYSNLADEWRYAWEFRPECFDAGELDYLKEQELSCRLQLITLSIDKTSGQPQSNEVIKIGKQYRYIGECYDMLTVPKVTKAAEYFDKFVNVELGGSNNHLERCIAYYTRGRFRMGRNEYKKALQDVKQARDCIETEVRGGACVGPLGLSESKRAEREVERKDMHFQVYAQMYLIYQRLGNRELAANRYKNAMKLAANYELVDALIDFLLFNAAEKSQMGDYAVADKLYKEAYSSRNRKFRDKDEKNKKLFTLFYDWARNEISVLDCGRALELAKEAYYKRPKNDTEAEWLVKALLLFDKLKEQSEDEDLSDKERLINLESIGDLYFELYIKCGESYTKCIKAAIDKYEAVVKLSTDHNHLAKIYSTLGNMNDELGKVDELIDMYNFALSESTKLDFSLDYLKDMIESLKFKSDQETCLKQLNNAEAHFTGDKSMLYRYVELVKETKEHFELETITEAMRLTELEDFCSTVTCNSNYVDDEYDITRQIERIVIPKQEREPKEVNVNRRNLKGETLLQEKICKMEHERETDANVADIRRLIDQGYSVNVYDNLGLTPLHEAANFGFPTIAKMLLDSGAAIDATTEPNLSFHSADLKEADETAGVGRITPLQDACSTLNGEMADILMDKLSVIEVLLNYNANTQVRNCNHKTPLQCFNEQRRAIIDDRGGYEYAKQLDKEHKDKLMSISKYLSRKTSEQQKDAKFRAKTATVTHVPSKNEFKEAREVLRNSKPAKPVISRGDRLMQLERQSVQPLHERNDKREMANGVHNQPSILNSLNSGIARRGTSSPKKPTKRRCFTGDENVPRSKVLKMDDEEESILSVNDDDDDVVMMDEPPPEFTSPSKLPSKTTTTSTTSTTSSGEPKKVIFRVQFESSMFQFSHDPRATIARLIDRCQLSDTVQEVIKAKKTANIRTVPNHVSLMLKESDGALISLDRHEVICDILDLDNKQNERLVFCIKDWIDKELTPRDLFKMHLKMNTGDEVYDSKFDSILDEAKRSGRFHLNGALSNSHLTTMINCFNHQSITAISLAGINLSAHCEELTQSVNQSKNIISLTLENCQLTCEHLDRIKLKSKSLTRLDLSSNKLGDCGAELATVLNGLPRLDTLKITRNRLSHKTLECYDVKLGELRCLNMSDNLDIGAAGLSSLQFLLSDQAHWGD